MKIYLKALSTSYLYTALSIGMNIVLIPLCLSNLELDHYGAYLASMALFNTLVVGVGWLSGPAVKDLIAQESPEGNLSETGQSDEIQHDSPLQRKHRQLFTLFSVYSVLSSVIVTSYLFSHDLNFGDQALIIGSIVIFNFSFLGLAADLCLLQAQQRLGTVNLTKSAVIILFLLFTLVAVPIFKSVSILFLSHAVANLILFVFLRIHLLKRNDLSLSPFCSIFKSITYLRSLPILPRYFMYSISNSFMTQMDVLVLSYLVEPGLIPFYVIFQKAIELLNQPITRLSEVSIPIFMKFDVEHQSAELKRSYTSIREFQHQFFLAAGGTFLLLGPFLLQLWIGEKATQLTPISFGIICCSSLFIIRNRHSHCFLYALGKLDNLNKLIVGEIVLRIALTILLVPFFLILAPLIALIVVQSLGLNYLYQLIAQDGLSEVGTKERSKGYHSYPMQFILLAVTAFLLTAYTGGKEPLWNLPWLAIAALVILGAVSITNAGRSFLALRHPTTSST